MRINLCEMYKVVVTEYDDGKQTPENIYFDNEKEAKDYVKGINSRNTDDRVPEYYVAAYYYGKVK